MYRQSSRYTARDGVDGSVRYRLFGEVAAVDGVDLGGRKQRTVLAALLLEPGRIVSLDRLIDAVWGDEAPGKPEASLRGYLSNLRAALGDGAALAWRDGGYVADVAPAEVDLHHFEQLVERASQLAREGRPRDAAASVQAARDLQRGRPLGVLADAPYFVATVARLDERAAQLDELTADLRLARGEAAELVAELTDAVAAHPLRERRRAQLALALYRAGRPVDALRSLEAARVELRDEIGVDPGPELVRLQHAILDHDPSLLWRAATVSAGSNPVAGFVGRRSEVERLINAASDVGSTGSIVVVSGAPGIGKTALVLAACERLGPWPTAWARCAEDSVDVPFGAWSTISAQLGRLGVAGAIALADGGDPVGRRAAIAEALQHAREPFCVVVDDLQWADAGTLGVLNLLSARMPAGMFLVVNVRSETLRPMALACLAELSRSALRIDLGGLTVDDIEQWIGDVPGRTGIARRIHDRTGGHPFFIRELVALVGTDGAEAALDRVPAAIHDVVRRRVGQLEPTAQQMLSTAAVIGQQFDLGVLAGVVDEPIDAVLDALDPAGAADLLTPDHERVGQLQFSHAIVAEALRAEQTPARLARTHAAVARVLERRWGDDVDAVIAELAVHAHAGSTAGTAEAAVTYGARAAERATAANAPGEATGHLARALDALLLAAPGDRARRQALLTALGTSHAAAGDAMAARNALVAAAALADARGDVDGVVVALRHVSGDDLWSGLDWSQVDEPTIAVVRRTLDALEPGSDIARAELLAALSAELYHGDPDASLAAARQAATMAAGSSDPLVEARALLQLCWAAWRPSGRADRAVAGTRLVALAASGRLPARFRPLAHLTRFVAAYEAGDGPLAERHLALARSSADPMRTPAEWTYVLYAEWSILVARGRYGEALALTGEVREAMRRSRPAVADVTWSGLRFQIATELARTDEALAALAQLEATPYAASAHWWRAWALARGGRLDEARTALRAFDGPLADDWYRTPLLCAAIEAAAAAGDADFAARHVDLLRPLLDHVAIAGSGGIVLGPVALTVARADLLLGDTDRARAAIVQAASVAAAFGSPPWLARVEAVRRELESP